ncbi:MAG: extracellular solute-binding protein [Bacilli bacterium]
MKKILLITSLIISMCLVSLFAKGVEEVNQTTGSEAPVKVSMFYSDNATLPFKADWLAINETAKNSNLEIEWEIIPISDYKTKVSLALNTGTNTPDVILYQTTKGENANLALNGALVAISDYSEWTPNFNKMVKDLNLDEVVDQLELKDGKRYYLPSLTDVPFYDGGLIMRQDLLEKYNLQAPKTFDDLYDVLKVFKKNNPDSYPLTILAGPRVLYRMTMPSFGVSVGKNGASGTNTLSWDYENKNYFTGAISDEYKAYVTYFHKLYAEGLLDPEMAEPIDGDRWSQKLATGKAQATYAYYDQIGGIEGASTIPGFNMQMYPALAGPAGAHHQPKSKTGSGIMFPAKTAKRADFEQIVRGVDNMFFSEDNSKFFCLGQEGLTYNLSSDGTVVFADSLVNSKEGVYKSLQIQYGCGSDVTQMVWINKREMTKYDANYAMINKEVEEMGDVIQTIPPTPNFDDVSSEEAGMYQTPLSDAFERWNDAFLTGAKSIDKDWDSYVAEMKNMGIDKFCAIYNDNL